MKLIISCIICLVPFLLHAQIISTYAGGGVGLGDGGPATAALVHAPAGGAFDKEGNFYFSQTSGENRIRKVNTSGIISTIAGNGSSGSGGDGGPASTALLNLPEGIAFDASGNLFIADANNNRIRKINMTTGTITTVVGNGIGGFGGDGGPAAAATLWDPQDICFDKIGNMFIADLVNNRVRKINTSGIISTHVGTGLGASTGDGGPATAANTSPWGVCVDDKDNLYIAEAGIGLCRIRKVTPAGIITTVAGTGIGTYNGDEIPATSANIIPVFITFKNGELYIVDQYNDRIRKVDAAGIIHTIAGTSVAGFSGDGGPATAARIYHPAGIALDSCNNVYFADNGNQRVRKITYNPNPCPHLGIEHVLTNQISIYPNPSNGILHIDNLQTTADYRLLNIIGAVLQQGRVNEGNNTIDIAGLPVGMYLVEVSNAAVGLRMMYKIVKQ